MCRLHFRRADALARRRQRAGVLERQDKRGSAPIPLNPATLIEGPCLLHINLLYISSLERLETGDASISRFPPVLKYDVNVN